MKHRRLLWMLLMLLVSTAYLPATAQDELTVNDDTKTTWLPIYGYGVTNYFRSQFIVPADLLEDIGIGQISRLVFYSKAYNLSYNGTFEISLVETEQTSLDNSTFISSGLTKVYTGSLTVDGNNQLSITFDTPFSYSGEKNLLIEFKQTVKGTSSVAYAFYGKTGETNAGRYGSNSSSVPTSGSNTVNVLPKMTFTYTSTGSVSAVKRPKNLAISNIKATSATISWDAVDGADSYELYYSTSSTAPTDDTSATVSGVTGTSHRLTGLTPETKYYVYARAVKGTEKSKWTSACKFTPSAAVNVDVNSSATSTTYYVPVYGSSTSIFTRSQFIIPSTHSVSMDSGTSTLSALSGKMLTKLTFYANTASAISWGAATFDVKLAEVTSTNFGSAAYNTTTSSTVYSGSLSVGADGKMVLLFAEPFEYKGGNLLIDFSQTAKGTSASVTWFCASENYASVYGYNSSSTPTSSPSQLSYLPKLTIGYITMPGNLAATNITKKGATITWDAAGSETEWQLSYSTTEGDPDNGTLVNNLTSRSCTLNNLTPETTYYAYVRAAEGDGEYGSWSKACEFTPSAALIATINNNATSSSAYSPVVYGPYANYTTRTQFIVPSNYSITTSSGTSTMGALAGTMIKKLTFYANTTSAISWGNAKFDVKLAEVTNTYFSSNSAITASSTTVYSGSLSVGANGKMEIEFSEPYVYNGGNLLVEFNQTATGTAVNANWFYSSSSNIGVYYSSYNSSYSRTSYMPKMSISYIVAPKNVTATDITKKSATITWDAAGSETEWQLSYSTTPNDPDHGTLVDNLTSRSCILNNLTPEFNHYVYIRAAEGDGEYGSWSKACVFKPTAAVTATINSTASSSNAYMPPIQGQYVSYSTNRSQFIVPSTYSITTGSGTSTMASLAGTMMTKLTFYAKTTSAVSWGATFDVKLAEVSATTFSSSSTSFNTTASTTVYSGSCSVGADGKMEIDFNSPFAYNGGNLLVEFNQTATGTNSTVNWYYSSVSGSGATQYSSYNPSKRDNMPKMTISYLAVPTNLATVSTNTSATLSWDAAGSETGWQVSYSTTPNDPDNGTKVNATLRSCTISGLTPETTYYAYVRTADGGDDFGSWSKVCEFKPCATMTINDGTATNSYVPINGGSAGSYIVSSKFIIPKEMMGGGHEIEKLTFYAQQESVSFESSTGYNTFDVYLTETDDNKFTSNAAYTGETKVYSGKLLVENGMMEITLDQPFTYSGLHNLLIAFTETKKWKNSATTWYGVNSGITSNCATYKADGYSSQTGYATFLPKTTFAFNTSNVGRPTNLVATNVLGTTATLSWDAVDGVDGYELSYGTVANPEDEGNTVVANLTETTLPVTGLTPKTAYYAYVRAKSGSTYGSWSSVCDFTTTAIAVVQSGITYELNDEGNAFVVKTCNDASTTAEIAATINYDETNYPVTTIANDAFKNHTALTEITIPLSVTNIGSNAFSGCSNVTTLHFGVNSDLDATSMYNVCSGLRSSVTTLDILEGTTTIPAGSSSNSNSSTYAKSFNYWSKVTSLTLPSTLQTIGNYGFYNCTGLTEVTIPAAVTSIGTDAFKNCTSVAVATFEGTTPPTWSDGTVGNQFNKPTGTFLVVPSLEAYAGWTAWVNRMVTNEPIVNGVFTYSVDGTNATIVGYNGTSTEVTIPATFTVDETTYDVVAIADDVFKGKTSVTTVTFERTTPPAWPDGTDGTEFNTASKTILIVPAAQEDAYKTAYTAWANNIYTSAVVQDRIIYAISGNQATVVGYTGTNYDGISQVTIPATITSGSDTYDVIAINSGVFYNKYWLTKVYFEGATPPTWPDGTIGNDFGRPTSTKIYVFEENVEAYQATYTAWTSAIYAKPDFTFTYNKSDYTAQVYSYDGRGGIVTIPSTVINPDDNAEYTVISIGSGNGTNRAFKDNTTVTAVTIPNTISSIGDYAFAGCTNLTIVNYPVAPANTTINTSAFRECTSLATLTLPEGLTTIGSSAFYNCSALTTVTIPSTVESINYAFGGCTGVTTAIFLPTTPPTWSDASNGIEFNGKANTKLVVPESENNTVLQAYQTAYTAWYNADAITTSLDNYITVNGLVYAVVEGTNTAKLVGYTNDVPAAAVIAATVNNGTADFTVTTIEEEALKNCTAMTSLTIPATVTTINGMTNVSPFMGCTNVTEVHFLGTTPPSWANQVMHNDFNTPANTALVVPAAALSTYKETYTAWMARIYAEGTTVPDMSVFTFGNYTGSGTEYLCTLTGYSGNAASVAIPEYVYYNGTTHKVTAIADEVFKNHTEMTSIVIPSFVKTIGSSAFEGCSGLTAVAIPYSGENPSIGSAAFKGCTSLASVTLPTQLSTISTSMFEDCTSLTGITLPSTTMRYILAAAFKNTGLTSITIPACVDINSGRFSRTAFADCDDLTDVYFEGHVVWWGGEEGEGGPAASEFATTAHTTLHVTGDETWFLEMYPEWFFQISSPNIIHDGNFMYLIKTNNATGDKYLALYGYQGTEDETVKIPAAATDPATNEEYPVTEIARNVFDGHSEITEMYIPSTISSVGLNAFKDMDNLELLVARGTPTFSMPGDASDQFGPNTKIVMPIGNLNNNNLARVLDARPGTSFYSGNILVYPFVYILNGDKLIVSEYLADDQASVTVPATVTDPYDNTVYDEFILSDGLFYNHTEITSLSAPSVTTLGTFENGRYRGSYVFPASLTSLSLPALIDIPDAAFPTNLSGLSGTMVGVFQRLVDLQSINLSSVEYVGTDAFTGLTNLTTLDLPLATTLADHAIINVENCTINLPVMTALTDTMQIAGLKNCTVNIPEVTDLRGVSLVGVDRLWTNTVENVTINAPSITSVVDRAFAPYNEMNNPIDLSGADLNFENLEEVGDAAFYKAKVGSLTMDKLTCIGDSAFMLAEIPTIKIPNSVTSVGKKAFFGTCMDVLRWYSNIDIPDSCFAYNMCMEYATVGDELVLNGVVESVGPTTIGDGAFMACPYLKNINIGNSVKHIGKNFLKYGRAITQLIIPSNVETIGDGFIQGCDHLRKCYLFNQPAEIGGEIDDTPIYQTAEEGSMAQPDSLMIDGEVVPARTFDLFHNKPETFSKKYVHSFMPSANYYVSKRVQNDAQDVSPCYSSSYNTLKVEPNGWDGDFANVKIGVNITGMNLYYPYIVHENHDEPLTGLNVHRLARAGWNNWANEHAAACSEYATTNVNPAEHVNNCTFYVNDNETYHEYLEATNADGIKVWERLDSLSAYNLEGTHGWAKYTGYELTPQILDKYFETYRGYYQQMDDFEATNGINKYPPFNSYSEKSTGLQYETDYRNYRPKITYYDIIQRGLDKYGSMTGICDFLFDSHLGSHYENKYIPLNGRTPVHEVDSISSLMWGPYTPMYMYYQAHPIYDTGCLGNGEATSFGDNYMYTIYFREKNFPKAKGTPGESDFEWGGYKNKYQIVQRDTILPPDDTWTPRILVPEYDGPIAVLKSCTAKKTTSSNPNNTNGTTTNTVTTYQLRFELVPKSKWWNDEKYLGKPCLMKGTKEWNYEYGGTFESPFWTADTRVTVPVTGDAADNTTVSMIGCKLDHMLDIDEYYVTTKNLTNPITHRTTPQMVFQQTTEYGGYTVKQFGAYFRIECDGIPVHDTKMSGTIPSSSRFTAFFEDENNTLTDINEYQMEQEHVSEGVYNLNGQRVSSNLNSLPAGIYIVNGKKVTVKGNKQ